ncbi:hypothetical protein [Roseateles cavernae]|uniref:hypothetical protein n=1 Tax=Roseateles cavernae TaxID=3153578 RepID=UPI0032E44537
MKNLQEATEKICELKGTVLAYQAALTAILRALPADAAQAVMQELRTEQEICTTVLLNHLVSEHTRTAFDRDIQPLFASLKRTLPPEPPDTPPHAWRGPQG